MIRLITDLMTVRTLSLTAHRYCSQRRITSRAAVRLLLIATEYRRSIRGATILPSPSNHISEYLPCVSTDRSQEQKRPPARRSRAATCALCDDNFVPFTSLQSRRKELHLAVETASRQHAAGTGEWRNASAWKGAVIGVRREWVEGACEDGLQVRVQQRGMDQ